MRRLVDRGNAPAALAGLAIAVAAISTDEPLVVLAALMVLFGAYVLWAIPMLTRRRQHDARR